MAENIFLALKGIKPVVSFLLDRYVQRFQATYQLLRKVKKKPALHLHSSQRSLAQLFAYPPPPTLTPKINFSVLPQPTISMVTYPGKVHLPCLLSQVQKHQDHKHLVLPREVH